MESVATEEGWHEAPDGKKLYTKSWIVHTPTPSPATSPAAVVIFIHGFSDHCNRYNDYFFPALAHQHSILVHSFDQRGWGRSVSQPSEKGLSGPTTTVLSDITSFIKAHLPSPAPLFLCGHSMGGQETLQWAARGPREIRKEFTGFIAEAPFVALHPKSQPSRFTVLGGRVVARFLPNRQMQTKLQAELNSRDEAYNQSYVDDPLCHDTGTLEGLAGMLERAEELDTGKVLIEDEDLRLLICHGSGDRITSYDASKRYFERLGKVRDKTYKSYDGWYHCMHAEPGEDRVNFEQDIAAWILARAKPEQGGDVAGSKSKL